MEERAALIIDIEKSRLYRVEERVKIQDFLIFCVDRLNDLFHSEMECEVIFSAGDELQGLFRDVTTALLYYRLIEMIVRPVKVRAGIGFGKWTVRVDGGLSTQQDGPAYHKARKAIEEIYGSQLHSVRICSDLDDVLANYLINASNSLKRQQAYMQDTVSLILELLYPMEKSGAILENPKKLKELLDRKISQKIGRRPFSSAGRRPKEDERVNLENLTVITPIEIDGIMKDAEETIIKKSSSQIIAEALGCSRQNVDMLIRRGYVNKIREMDYMALQYVDILYGG